MNGDEIGTTVGLALFALARPCIASGRGIHPVAKLCLRTVRPIGTSADSGGGHRGRRAAGRGCFCCRSG
jgi:hypothetical protein